MLQLVQLVMNFLFGCSHHRTSFPITPVRRGSGAPYAGVARFGTYVACLDCGKELAYDWEEMRVVGPVLPRKAAAEVQPSYR